VLFAFSYAGTPNTLPTANRAQSQTEADQQVDQRHPPEVINPRAQSEIGEALRAIEKDREAERREDKARETWWWPPSASWAIVYVTVIYVFVAGFQWAAIWRQANIAEQTLIAGREPYLAATDLRIIKTLENNNVTTLGISYRLTNYGPGPAVVGHAAVICEARESLKQPPAYAGALLQWATIGQVLASHDCTEVFEVWSKLTLKDGRDGNADSESQVFLRGDAAQCFFLYGEVFYDDLLGNGYVTGFAAVWDHERQRVRLASDQEAHGYNYRYVFRGGNATAFASIWRRIYRRLFK
jgi:hypothetical protein